MKTSLNNLLFHVEKAPIAEVLGVETISSTEYGIFGYVNGRDQKPIFIGAFSDVYELVPNVDIFPVVEFMLKSAGIEFEATYRMLDYSRFYADYQIKTTGVVVGSETNRKDKLFPLLRIEHSYNGLLKYHLTFGWFRTVCLNCLTLPVTDQNIETTGKHTKQILYSLSLLIEKVNYFIKHRKRFTEKYEVIADRWSEDWTNRVEGIIDATGIGKRGFQQITDKIMEEAALLNEGRVNDWLIYNGFNYHIYNAKTKDGKAYDTAPNLRHVQDRKIFEAVFSNPGIVKQ